MTWISYTNRIGTVYHLCAVTTKTGKRRYVFRRDPGQNRLDKIPLGYEIVESINGQVSLRKTTASPIGEEEADAIRRALGRHEHLARYEVDTRKDAIVVYEPYGGVHEIARVLGVTPEQLGRLTSRTRYSPVFRFVLLDKPKRTFLAQRMCYRGSVDGWLTLSLGALDKLADRYLHHLGKDSFFELD